MKFNPPPNWPTMPNDWVPLTGWAPDPAWPPAPPNWQFWTHDESPTKRGELPPTGQRPHQQPSGRTRTRTRILVGAAVVIAFSGATIFGYLYFKGPDTTELHFTGLDAPEGIAVDTSGNVFVADLGTKRVYTLTRGANSATEVPLPGLHGPRDVAVNKTGDIFVIDADEGHTDGQRVLRLDSGSKTPTELPTAGLHTPTSIAIDGSGTIYVTDTENMASKNRLLQLTPGTDRWTEINHPGLEYPSFVAVDANGNLYATDANRSIAKRPAGSTRWTTIVPDDVERGKFRTLFGIATDTAGNAYIVGNTGDEGQHPNSMKGLILKVDSETGRVTQTHFKDAGFLVDIAVDANGSLYVTDETNHRVRRVDG